MSRSDCARFAPDLELRSAPGRACTCCAVCFARVCFLVFRVFARLSAAFFSSGPFMSPKCQFDLIPGAKAAMRWAFPKKPGDQLPSTYVLIKRKKEFEKARSIIGYHAYFMAKIQRALGRVILDLLELTFGCASFNCPSIDHVMGKLRQFSRMVDDAWSASRSKPTKIQVEIHADDLAGFFPSPPQWAMVRAAEWLLERICQLKGCPPHQIRTSVSLGTKTKCFFGKYVTTSNHKTFHFSFFLELLTFSLEAAVCDVYGEVKKQIRGGPIGSPLSPAWLTLLVCLEEYKWLHGNLHNPSMRFKTWDTIRYVDNRLVLSLCFDGINSTPKELFNDHFYGESVILEPEPKTSLVGSELLFEINVAQYSGLQRRPALEVRYIVAGFPEVFRPDDKIDSAELWRDRPHDVAASKTSLLVGFIGRLHLAVRGSFPRSRQQEAIARVIFVFLTLGYGPNLLMKPLVKFLRSQAMSNTISSDWSTAVRQAVQQNNRALVHLWGGR